MPYFHGQIDIDKSVVYYYLYREYWPSFLEYNEDLGNPDSVKWYSKEDGLTMKDYESMYCWTLAVAVLDAGDKKITLNDRLRKCIHTQIETP
jgi:hypothetical protein